MQFTEPTFKHGMPSDLADLRSRMCDTAMMKLSLALQRAMSALKTLVTTIAAEMKCNTAARKEGMERKQFRRAITGANVEISRTDCSSRVHSAGRRQRSKRGRSARLKWKYNFANGNNTRAHIYRKRERDTSSPTLSRSAPRAPGADSCLISRFSTPRSPRASELDRASAPKLIYFRKW